MTNNELLEWADDLFRLLVAKDNPVQPTWYKAILRLLEEVDDLRLHITEEHPRLINRIHGLENESASLRYDNARLRRREEAARRP